jgi:hypothetical protein
VVICDDFFGEHRALRAKSPLTRVHMLHPMRTGWPTRIGAVLPAVVREGLVRLGHLVRVFATFHSGTQAVARV